MLAVVGAMVLFVVAALAFGWWQFSRIERVQIGSLAPAVGGATNYLIVGSDSREGIGEEDPNAGAFLGGEAPSGQRTDTIMVMRVGGSGASLLSIPRDLWVRNPVTGEMGRINSVYQSGPSALVEVVNGLGIPIQHFMEIDFVSFGKLVDAVGGITIPFEHPARDDHSGLDVPEAGEVTLDGSQALAYVRSRYFEQLVDGEWQVDGTADLGRVQRQRAFLSALMGKVSSTRNPWTLAGVAGSLGPGMRIDQDLSYLDALLLMWDLRGGLGDDSVTLPVTGRRTSGGAAVLELQAGPAEQVIGQFLGT